MIYGMTFRILEFLSPLYPPENEQNVNVLPFPKNVSIFSKKYVYYMCTKIAFIAIVTNNMKL